MAVPKQFIIADVQARQILDSRGNPTVETKVVLTGGISAKASVPSGASTGVHEACELRDKKQNIYFGKGVLSAVNNVNKVIRKALLKKDVREQRALDKLMLSLDGTENKSKLGANAILSVSLACARAGALASGLPLYRYLREIFGIKGKKYILPIPSFNILNGGKHADNNLDFQEYMLFPAGVKSAAEQVRAGAEIFQQLKHLLNKKNLVTSVGDEGGFAPSLKNNEEALEIISQAVKNAGWQLGKEIFFALDPAASEFYDGKKYVLKGEKKGGLSLSGAEMIKYWQKLIDKYPIISIEDGLAEDDWPAWQDLTYQLGDEIQLVGDDLLVTNVERLQKAIDSGVANAILIKVNQIGSLSETIDAILLAQKHEYGVMISHRSGETPDDFIVDLAVATNAGQLKSGSLSRGERIAKYNRLMEIEMELNKKW
ncbi:MAG TPA: phosphopyruvate hydratase [bacterium]|mgnify:CR=1 FL=1|nr:phosphopyruvate hydratase [bacterium]